MERGKRRNGYDNEGLVRKEMIVMIVDDVESFVLVSFLVSQSAMSGFFGLLLVAISLVLLTTFSITRLT